MVACTSMEVFAWVTLGGLIAQPICTMLHLLLEKCNTLRFQSLLNFSIFFLILIFLSSPTLMIPQNN